MKEQIADIVQAKLGQQLGSAGTDAAQELDAILEIQRFAIGFRHAFIVFGEWGP